MGCYSNCLNIMVACILGALLVGCSSQDVVYQSASSENAAMEEDISSEETSPFAVESEDNQHTGKPDQEQEPDSLLPGDDKLHWVGFPRWEERPGVLEEPNLYCDDSGGRYWVLRLREKDELYGGLQQLYIYDSRLERLALLWEFSGSDQIIHPRIVGMDRWNLLLIEEGAILLDADGTPWPEQPRQEDWTVRHGLATDDGGLLLLGDNDDQKQVIAVFDSAGSLVSRIDTPWPSDFYYYINSSMEFRVYGDILVQSPRYSQVLLWTNLADGDRRLAGSRWARSGDTIITAEMEKAYDQEQMRVTLFCYQDFEQVGSVTYYLDQELPRDWRLRYLPQENGVEVVYLEYQDAVLDTVWLSLDGMA